MSVFDFSPYAVGGATRPDSFTGMADEFSAALMRLISEAPPEIRQQLRIGSGYRSNERQAQLWAEAVQKYGSEEEARKWVAPPGRSQHNHGNAADLKYLSPEAREWMHRNAARYGLAFPLANEDWHIELASARGSQPQSSPAITSGNVLSTSAPPAQQNALATEQRPFFRYNALQLEPFRMT